MINATFSYPERYVRQKAFEEREEKSMNGRKKNRIRSFLAAVLIAGVISACGRSNFASYDTAAGAPAVTEEIVNESAAYDAGASYDLAKATGYEYAEAAAAEEVVDEGYEQGTVTEAEAATERKLIKTVNISAETEQFDVLVPGLQKQVETLGGYIESISVYDVNSYYVGEQMVKQRCANLTARVPKEKLDGFLAQVGEQTNVTSRSESVEDVTLQYVDLESHKKALLTEQERLLSLMEQAESVEDIIAIEGRLSEVRYQLESMESQLRTYDNQIDYSTVYLTIEEVRKYSPSEDASVAQRIQSGFMKSLENIGYGIRDFAIRFVIDIPYMILWLVIAAVAVVVLRIIYRLWKKRAKRREAVRKEKGLEPAQRRVQFRSPVTIRYGQEKATKMQAEDSEQETDK